MNRDDLIEWLTDYRSRGIADEAQPVFTITLTQMNALITALSPVLSEDVQETIAYYRDQTNPNWSPSTADLIERLAREKGFYQIKTVEQQQRLDEFGEEEAALVRDFTAELDSHKAQIAEYREHLAQWPTPENIEALERIRGMKHE